MLLDSRATVDVKNRLMLINSVSFPKWILFIAAYIKTPNEPRPIQEFHPSYEECGMKSTGRPLECPTAVVRRLVDPTGRAWSDSWIVTTFIQLSGRWRAAYVIWSHEHSKDAVYMAESGRADLMRTVQMKEEMQCHAYCAIQIIPAYCAILIRYLLIVRSLF